jgi:hypothetical protein
LIGILLLALALPITGAYCTKPSPGPPWPEPQWHPMSPEDARPPTTMTQIKVWKYGHPPEKPDTVPLDANEPFYLTAWWNIVVKNIAYRADTGAAVKPYEDIQDRSGPAMAIWTIIFNGKRLNPTYSYTGTGEWIHFDNTDSSDPNDPSAVWYEAVAPLCRETEHYYVFPSGLPVGTYHVHAELKPAGNFPGGWPTYDFDLVVSY